DLGEDRLHALALRRGAAGDIELAGRFDAHQRALERPNSGALDVEADAEPEMTAFAPRRGLARTDGRNAADRLQCQLQRARIAAAVVDDRLAIAIQQPDMVGHL